MKNLKLIVILITLLTISFYSCKEEPTTKFYWDNTQIKIFDNVSYQIIIIDSCEYIIGKDDSPYNGGYFLTHKGNCKFCTKRNNK